MTEQSLTEQDMVDILEDLARNSQSAVARIQAIKLLREIFAGAKPVPEQLQGLYEVSNPGKLRSKTVS